MKAILKKVKQSFSDWYDCILKDEFILALASFSDIQSFSCLEFDEILASTVKLKITTLNNLLLMGAILIV